MKRAAVMMVVAIGLSLPVPGPAQADMLPTLRTHMAQLGTLMNRLFREIDEPDMASDLIGVTQEMEALLLRAAEFPPPKMRDDPDPERRATGIRGFRACLAKARRALTELRQALAAETSSVPKDRLLYLDQVRRDCHSTFA